MNHRVFLHELWSRRVCATPVQKDPGSLLTNVTRDLHAQRAVQATAKPRLRGHVWYKPCQSAGPILIALKPTETLGGERDSPPVLLAAGLTTCAASHAGHLRVYSGPL